MTNYHGPVLPAVALVLLTSAALLLAFQKRQKPKSDNDTKKYAPWDPEDSDANSHLQVDFEKHINKKCPKTGDSYLVIGGCGFLGRRIVEVLLERGERNVVVFDVVAPNEQDTTLVKYIQGDVTNLSQIVAACTGIDTVFATFAIIRFMERLDYQRPLSERINVEGTRNIIKACQTCGVKYFIQTSTSNVSVGFTGRNGLSMTEEDPYVDKRTSYNHYGYTKAEAEKLVRQANTNDQLRTVSIRPCSGIFGPRDGLITQNAISNNQNIVLFKDSIQDYVYVDNVVFGHLLAEAKLRKNDSDCDQNNIAGEAFCISNNEPLKHGEFWNRFQYYRPELKVTYVPPLVSWTIAYIVETLQYISNGALVQDKELSLMTPPMLYVASTDFVFRIDKARRLLDYEPIYTVDQGIQRVVWEDNERRNQTATT